MKNRYIRGFIRGSMFGLAASMFIMPRLDKRTRRRILDGGRNIVDGFYRITLKK
ncbi:MAG: hypothetical protein ACFWUE_10850 [Xylanivirga thermophila]|uniref:hypothetical protein n=1 Tax=Xylanivirga thermophila TaxID=2496273 RepID=UPI0013EC57A7|nr:hypothetical protein [Xylanivirga thermophila]